MTAPRSLGDVLQAVLDLPYRSSTLGQCLSLAAAIAPHHDDGRHWLIMSAHTFWCRLNGVDVTTREAQP